MDLSAYVLIPAAPAPREYCDLRLVAGLSPKTLAQAAAAIEGSWSACHGVARQDEAPVVMGRVIGDGGTSTSPTWPLALTISAAGWEPLSWSALETIRDAVVDEPYVTLMADPPGRALYERFGFLETAPDSVGMRLAAP